MPMRSFRATALRFVVTHLVVTAIVAAAAVGWSCIAARARALDATAQAARGDATALVAPLCTAGLGRGDAHAVSALDRVVRGQLRDGSVLRVKVWTPQGRILYSDAPALIGRSYPLRREERDLLGTAGAIAEVSDLNREENLLESAAGHLVEAYAAMAAADGTALLFEAYYVVDRVDAAARHDYWAIIPLALVTIFGLYLLQAPLVLRLARGVDSAHRRRRGRLRRAASRADLERARAARDLRDGVVQDLAGVAYLLESTGAEAVRPATTVLQDDLRRLRRTVRDLSVTGGPTGETVRVAVK
jgi:two-component system NarL family sensor kinase